MSILNLVIQIWLLTTTALSVKIAVSKMGTSTTVITIDSTTPLPDYTTSISTDENTPLNTETFQSFLTTTPPSVDLTTEESSFPPKLKKQTQNTISKLSTSTSTTTTTTLRPTTAVATNLMPGNASDDTEITSNFSPANGPRIYCPCNLLPSTCDINCCCDPDCPKTVLKVFNCFLPSKHPELRLRLEDFQYEHGLPSCKINDGWFCVFRTNTRPPIEKVLHYNFDTTNNYKWPSLILNVDQEHESKERNFYKFGDTIKLFNLETLQIQDFELPFAFKSPHCLVKEPVRHLVPTQRICLLKSSEKVLYTTNNLRRIFSTMKLKSKPGNQILEKSVQERLSFNFVAKVCRKNTLFKEYNCRNLSITTNETDIDDSQYYVNEFNIKIVHNFTDLLACVVEMHESDQSSELWQKFNVEFIAANSTVPLTSSVLNKVTTETKSKLSYSGPLGYLQGEPIIIAKYVAKNESEEISEQNRILNYFKEPLLENNTLKILTRKNGLCDRYNGSSYSINFGISSLSQCNLRASNESLTKLTSFSKNFTEICSQLQSKILVQLFGEPVFNLNDLNELFVSTLGHPKISNSTDKWLSLQVENLENVLVTGHLNTESHTLVCRNILLNANYEFHIGVFTERSIAKQALIKKAVLKLGKRHDLEFTLDERLEVPLTLSVMFYDLTLNLGKHREGNFMLNVQCAIFSLWFVQYA